MIYNAILFYSATLLSGVLDYEALHCSHFSYMCSNLIKKTEI